MKTFIYCTAVSACISIAAIASPAPVDRNGAKFPARGIELPVLQGAVSEPVKPPPARTVSAWKQDYSGKKLEQVEKTVYECTAVWLADARVGRWRNKRGDVLTLWELRCGFPQPANAFEGHASMEEINAAMEESARGFSPTPEEAALLASTVAGISVSQFMQVKRKPSGVDVLLTAESGESVACVFRLKGIGYKAPPGGWFVLEYKPGGKTAPGDGMKTLEAVLSGIRPLQKPRAAVQAGRGGKGPSGDDRREAARRSIEGLKGWWSHESPEYIFLLDISKGAGGSLLKQIERQMGPMRKAYARYVKPDRPVGSCVARIFATEEEYRNYMRDNGEGEGGMSEWSCGVWDPSRGELACMGNGKDISNVLKTFRHEGFHQYLHYAMDCGEQAMWFNEGHACMFESVSPAGNDVRVNEGSPAKPDKSGRRALTRAESVDRNPSKIASLLQAVMRMDRKQFYSGDIGDHYTAAWALCYFLQKGPLVSPRDFGAYSAVIPEYLKVLHETKDCMAASQAALDRISGRDLKSDFLLFWSKYRGRAKNSEPK